MILMTPRGECGIETSYMDQTDENEEYLNILHRMIQEKRLHVRVNTRSVLHASVPPDQGRGSLAEREIGFLVRNS